MYFVRIIPLLFIVFFGVAIVYGLSPSKNPQNLTLSVAGYKYDRTESLIEGRVSINECDVHFQEMGIGDINTNVLIGPQTLDVTEIGLHPFILAYVNEGFRDYILLPIFTLRLFRHRSIFVRTDGEIKKPEDLRGKRIAIVGYSSTSLTWIRGIFEDEYGIKPEDVEWVVSSKDSSAKTSGRVSQQESVLPKGIQITKGTDGKDESELLISGEVDAIFHAAEPKAFIDGNNKIARLFPDYRSVEQAYFSKTGIFPIMHAVAVKKDLIKKYPWLVDAIFKAYSQSKQLAYDYLATSAWYKSSLPWIGQEFKDTRALMGNNYYSYGLENNRKALETLFRYSYQQGLSEREVTVDELFTPVSLDLTEPH